MLYVYGVVDRNIADDHCHYHCSHITLIFITKLSSCANKKKRRIESITGDKVK